jgi:integrase
VRRSWAQDTTKGGRQRGPGSSKVHCLPACCRRCLVVGFPVPRLWPVAQVRPVWFKATRAACASVLIQMGASPAAVASVLGHADVKATMERYAALAPGFMRSQVEPLRLGFPVEAPAQVAAGAEAGQFAASLLQEEGEA